MAKKKSPSRQRYDADRPVISIRVPADLKQRGKHPDYRRKQIAIKAWPDLNAGLSHPYKQPGAGLLFPKSRPDHFYR